MELVNLPVARLKNTIFNFEFERLLGFKKVHPTISVTRSLSRIKQRNRRAEDFHEENNITYLFFSWKLV